MKEAIKIKPVQVFGKNFDSVLFSPANISVDDTNKTVRLQAIVYDSSDAKNNMPVQNLPSLKLPIELEFTGVDYAEICQQALVKLNVQLP